MNELTTEASVGSGLVPRLQVQVTTESARIAVPHHEATDAPRINLIREGDTVKCIEVTCACGKQVRLHCVY